MADEEMLMSSDEVISFLRHLSTTGVRGSTAFNIDGSVGVLVTKRIVKKEMNNCDYWKFVTSPILDGIIVFLKWENYEYLYNIFMLYRETRRDSNSHYTIKKMCVLTITPPVYNSFLLKTF